MKAKLGKFYFANTNERTIVLNNPANNLIQKLLERSRQSARECRARKKLRYQYLEELVADREKAVLSLRAELEKVNRATKWGNHVFNLNLSFQYRQFASELDAGRFPDEMQAILEEVGALKQE